MEAKRAEVIEHIEVAVVELKNDAQPRDLAELRALALDAKDATTDAELDDILMHAKNLIAFCEERTKSSGNNRSTRR